ncbi:large ribosomal subunit protein uL15m-like isoform X2 [Oculina patagonica]
MHKNNIFIHVKFKLHILTFRYKKIYSPLNLNRLQFFVDSGRINPKEPITMYHLWRSGAIAGRIRDGVTLLGGGTTGFQAKLNIEVSRASKTAIKAIERQGGKITCAYYNPLGLRQLLKPEKFEGRRIPRRARPPRKFMEYYTSVENRGYLADPVDLENARLQTYKLENEVD